MNYSSSIYVLSGFLTFFSIIFFYISYRSPQRGKNVFSRLLSKRSVFAIFGFLYFALAHWGLLAAAGLGINQLNIAPCENVVVNSTESGDVNYYSYDDSCEDRVVTSTVETMYKLITTLLYIDVLALFIGGLFYTIVGVFAKL